MAGVVTRFAPSPTGFLHVGGARTALFNWLFARGRGGRFLLRIEDTDRARSTPEATEAIFEGLAWLGLDWDGDAISQFDRRDRHAEAAAAMLEKGTAYRCFSTPEEIEAAREAARAAGTSTIFRSPWRDSGPGDWPDLPHVVRLKAPRTGETEIEDRVQGRVTWANDTLDDLVLLRSDGTPTYMLAVVVDDHDMAVSHVIRGDDHLTNAARQVLIYRAMGWEPPEFAHIPLIHGPDGKKLSKRHGAVGIGEYRDAGYPARAMRNYLARLGWSHGDDEFFTDEEARLWFGFEGMGKSPSRFDFKKLASISGQHIRSMEAAELLEELKAYAASQHDHSLEGARESRLLAALPELTQRARTYRELLESTYFITAKRPLVLDEKAAATLATASRGILSELTSRVRDATWTHNELETVLREFAEGQGHAIGQIMQPLRAALTGRASSPGVINVMEIIGRQETIARLEDALGQLPDG